MEIHSNVIYFKSEGWCYAKEFNGRKPNTVRLLTPEERTHVELWYSQHLSEGKPLFIRVINKDYEWENFERRLTDISCIGQILGYFVYIFSWEHKEEKR